MRNCRPPMRLSCSRPIPGRRSRSSSRNAKPRRGPIQALRPFWLRSNRAPAFSATVFGEPAYFARRSKSPDAKFSRPLRGGGRVLGLAVGGLDRSVDIHARYCAGGEGSCEISGASDDLRRIHPSHMLGTEAVDERGAGRGTTLGLRDRGCESASWPLRRSFWHWQGALTLSPEPALTGIRATFATAEQSLQIHPTRGPQRARLSRPTSAIPKTSRLIGGSRAFAAAAKRRERPCSALQRGCQKRADMPV